MRKKWIVGVLVALLTFGGVAYAADAVAPTLTDLYNLLQEIKAELAVVKQQTAPGASANTNQAGELAKATSSDGKVTIVITSLMAGPDATVIGFTVTNNQASGEIMMSSFDTKLTAAGQEIKKDTLRDGLQGNVLPNTSKKGLILADPLPANATELVITTKLYDTSNYNTVLAPTFTLKLK